MFFCQKLFQNQKNVIEKLIKDEVSACTTKPFEKCTALYLTNPYYHFTTITLTPSQFTIHQLSPLFYRFISLPSTSHPSLPSTSHHPPFPPPHILSPPPPPHSPLTRLKVKNSVRGGKFYWFIITIVFLNTLSVAVEHYNQPPFLTLFLCE